MTRLRLVGLAVLAGAAAGLGHAPFNLWPVALAGFAGVVWLVTRSGFPIFAGWAAGAGYFGLTLHWIVEPFLVEPEVHGWMAPFALVLMAGGLALFWGAAGWLARRLGGGAITFALALTLAEIARGHVLTGFPWVLPAYIWTETLVMRFSAHVGPYGLTLITLVLVALPVAASRPRHSALLTAAGAVAVSLMFAEGIARELTDETGGGGSVRVVQPNAPQDEKWHPDTAGLFVQRQIEFSAKDGDPDLIIWPEAAVPYPLDLSGPVLQTATAAANAPILLGINRRNDADEWFNSSVLVAADGTVAQTYDKVHLVPFGEYIPGRIDLIRAMAARSNYGFSAGERVRTIDTPVGRALVLICYEAIFPRHIRRAEMRPDYLLQITNDAWFGTFAGPQQHLQQARFRAVEQGLPLVRVANTGISALIDARGVVRASLPLGEAGYIDTELTGALPPTLYARTGDLPVIVLVSLGLLGSALRKRIASRPAAS